MALPAVTAADLRVRSWTCANPLFAAPRMVETVGIAEHQASEVRAVRPATAAHMLRLATEVAVAHLVVEGATLAVVAEEAVARAVVVAAVARAAVEVEVTPAVVIASWKSCCE